MNNRADLLRSFFFLHPLWAWLARKTAPRVPLYIPDAIVAQAAVHAHNAYEAQAIRSGWSTQEASRKPWAEVPAANKECTRAAVRAALAYAMPRMK